MQNDIKEIEEDSGDEKENEDVKPEVKREPQMKQEKGVRTEEDIMQEYGLEDYDNEQVNKHYLKPLEPVVRIQHFFITDPDW